MKSGTLATPLPANRLNEEGMGNVQYAHHDMAHNLANRASLLRFSILGCDVR